MNLPFFIARRYFFSRKIPNVIHIISGISLLGIMVVSFALITILSAFNGFEDVVNRLYNTFDSSVKIIPAKGKYLLPDSAKISEISKIRGITAMSGVIEDGALLIYHDRQAFCTIKAIEPSYLHSMHIDSMVFLGDAVLHEDHRDYTIIGAGIAGKLNIAGADELHPIQVYVAKKGKMTILNPENALNMKNILCSGIFSVQQDFDNKYILMPIDFARELLDEPNKVTSIEINLDSTANINKTIERISYIMGSDYQVLDRQHQQPVLYRVMKIEKLAVYLVLSFVLLIAIFNLIGALLMLAIEKKKDMAVLISMGGNSALIRNIIFFEGILL